MKNICGNGYIIVASGVDRDLFVQKCLRTSTVSMLTDNNVVIHNIKVARHCLVDLIFPQTNKQLGSSVVWINDSEKLFPMIVAVLSKNDEIYTLNENQFELEKHNDKCTVSVVGDRINKSMSVNVISQDSAKMYLNVKSKTSEAQMNVEIDGVFSLKTQDSIQMQFVSSFELKQFKSKKNDKFFKFVFDKDSGLMLSDEWENQFSTNQKGTFIDGKKIVLGDDKDSKAMLLSDKLILQLNKNKLRVSAIIQAINSAPVVPGDGGASFKSALIVSLSALQSEDYSNVTSTKVKNS